MKLELQESNIMETELQQFDVKADPRGFDVWRLNPEELRVEKTEIRQFELPDTEPPEMEVEKTELQKYELVKMEPQEFEVTTSGPPELEAMKKEAQEFEVMKNEHQEVVDVKTEPQEVEVTEMILPDWSEADTGTGMEPVVMETEHGLSVCTDSSELKNESSYIVNMLNTSIVSTQQFMQDESGKENLELSLLQVEEGTGNRSSAHVDPVVDDFTVVKYGSTPKRKELTLREKVQLIRRSDGKSHRALAQEFQIGRTQVGCILKRKAQLMAAYEKEANPDRKRFFQNSPYTEIDTIVFEWFSRMQSLNISVSGSMIQTKALDIAKALNQPDFKASGGWLSRFKNRHIIGGSKISGEKSTVRQETIDNWHEHLPNILEGYNPRDIFNMDETGVFYRALPDKTLTVTGSEMSGGMKSQECLTVALCVNQLGEFEKPLVIGTTLHSRCFWNLDIDKLPVIWRANKQASMTTSLFEEWVKDFNCCMSIQNRHVILLLDSTPSHLHDLQLSNVKLIYLPADATSCLHPLDQGIFQAVKLQYRCHLLQYAITKAEADPEPQAIYKSIDVHLAVTWLQAAISDVKSITVQKCFKKTGIPFPTDPSAVDPTEDEGIAPLAELLYQATSALNLPEPMSAKEYMAMDDSCSANDTLDDGSESHIIEEATAEPDPASSDEGESVPSRQLTDGEVQDMLAALQVHFLQKNYSRTLDFLQATQQQFQDEKLTKCTSQTTLDNLHKHV